MKQLFTLSFCLLLINTGLKAQKQPDHVLVLMLENHSYLEIKDSTKAPYINSLLIDSFAAAFTQSFALTHPSQPNYIMLFSGSNQGVTDDNVPSVLPFKTPNLGSSLLQKGFTFVAYSEDLPSVGYTGATSGSYARKHCPWVNWQGSPTNGIPSNLNQPFNAFPKDFTKLPTLSFVIPNLLDDMHDGTVGAADNWIKNNLSTYVEWCKTNNSLFILTVDEDDKTDGNQIYSIILGQDVKGGTYAQPITHYNFLRTIEDLYGLPYAGASKDSSDIVGIWKTTLPIQLESISAKRVGNINMIEWKCAAETNGAYFEVQSSPDGRSFTTIGKISVTGNNSKYSFPDSKAQSASTYYRLKMVDKNGSAAYSNVVRVTMATNTITISPNPAKSFATINFNQSVSDGKISVTNLNGKTVFEQSFKSNLSAYELNTQSLVNGLYIVTVKTSTGSYTEKLLISK